MKTSHFPRLPEKEKLPGERNAKAAPPLELGRFHGLRLVTTVSYSLELE